MEFIYRIVGFEKMEGTTLENVVEIIVVAKDETEGLEKAKKMVTKPLYRISGASEIGSKTEDERWQKQHELNIRVADNNDRTYENNVLIRKSIAELGIAIEKLSKKA